MEGDPNNERDFLWRNLGEDRALVTVPFRRDGDALKAHFPIVLASA